MPVKCLMTWNAKQKRWSKKYRKRQYFVSCKQLGAPPTKEGSRQSANEWWENKQREIDSENKDVSEYEHAIDVRKRLISDANYQLLSANSHANIPAEIATLEGELQAGKLRQLTPYESDPAQYWRDVQDRWANIVRSEWDRFENGSTDEEPLETTIAASIAAFLKLKMAEVESKALSTGRYESLRCHLQHFGKFTNKHEPVTSINSQVLLGYRTALLKEVQHELISDTSARDRIVSVRQFVRHLWRIELIDQLPRVMDDLTIRVATKSVKTFTDDEIMLLLAEVGGAGKLYVLLSLNCGMLQKDISDLKQTEVNWNEGRITRKRSKTQHHDEVPTVCYKLWPETFELLQKYRSEHPTLALTNRCGNPLQRDPIVNGKQQRTCNITSVWYRVRVKAGIDKPFKLLRKTSASKVASKYPLFRVLFLGQSDATIADKHYISTDQDGFDEAVTWLGEQFGLVGGG